VDYVIDRSRRLVLTRGVDPLDVETVKATLKRLAADEAFDPAFDHLADYSQAAPGSVEAEGIRALSRVEVFSPSARRAVVVQPGFAYGIARMYESLKYGQGNVAVFTTRDEALAWLGHPAE